jgi:hypothetical protein
MGVRWSAPADVPGGGVMDECPETIASLVEVAISQHEMFVSWVAAGFTEAQALELLKAVVTEIVRRVR